VFRRLALLVPSLCPPNDRRALSPRITETVPDPPNGVAGVPGSAGVEVGAFRGFATMDANPTLLDVANALNPIMAPARAPTFCGARRVCTRAEQRNAGPGSPAA
jgi:hypothetical protein